MCDGVDRSIKNITAAQDGSSVRSPQASSPERTPPACSAELKAKPAGQVRSQVFTRRGVRKHMDDSRA